MEDDHRNTDLFHQDLQDESSSTNLENENPQGAMLGIPLDDTAKQTNSMEGAHQVKPASTILEQQPQQQHPDPTLLVQEKIVFHEPNEEQQEGFGGSEQLKKSHLQENTAKEFDGAVVQIAKETQEESPTKPDEQRAAVETSKDGSDILPRITEIIVNELGAASASAGGKSGADERATMDNSSITKTEIEAGTVPSKKAQKRPRAKPGFGLRTSRTTIVETGQKRRSCICTNSKLCNELMTRWAKVSPPDYHCKYHDSMLLVFPSLYLQ